MTEKRLVRIVGTATALPIALLAVSLAYADDLNGCVTAKSSFDGIEPLKYKVVNAGDSRVYIHREYPLSCPADGSCGDRSYIDADDIVALGKTCGSWSYVQHIGEKAVRYGWVASDRLEDWNPSHGNGTSSTPTSTAAAAAIRYKFKLIEGLGTPVCEADLQRLNQTAFIRAPYCGRPENDSIPGFEWLRRVPVSTNEANRISGAKIPDQDKVAAWRYQPEIDVDNDSLADNVIVWNLDDPDDPGCGSAYYGVNPMLDEGYQVVLVMTADGQSVDAARTQNIFGDPSIKDSTVVDMSYVPGRPLVQGFHPYGHSYGLFRYRGLTYFDTFLANRSRLTYPAGDEPSTLRVYLRQSNTTRTMCTLRVLY